MGDAVHVRSNNELKLSHLAKRLWGMYCPYSRLFRRAIHGGYQNLKWGKSVPRPQKGYLYYQPPGQPDRRV